MDHNTETQVNNTTRTGGEKDVPLNVWNSRQFQSWYQSHLKVGNKLLSAKLLWSLPINEKIFSYVLHVNIWIAAEDRVKSNEFIISRPDISVVVPYWKHPTDISKSEIILIKEFRSPSRTKDGFVHELPGGSSFKSVNDNFKLASDELYEETSLRINTERFRYLDSKQMMATWSTHFANVYAVELTQDEIEHAKQLAASKQIFGVEEDTERTYVEVYQLKDIGQYVDWSMEGMIYRAVFVD